MVRESLEPGQSVSAVSAGEAVVPDSDLSDALKQIRELQRMLDKKTMEAEILKEVVGIGRSRKWIAHSPLLPGTTNKAGQQMSRCGALATNGSNQAIGIAQDTAKQVCE